MLFDNVHGDERGLEGSKLRLERAPVCSCVLVSGLRDETTEDTIQLYFENKRSGGNVVSKVERETKSSALVYFRDPSSKKTLSSVYRLSVPTLEVRLRTQTKLLGFERVKQHLQKGKHNLPTDSFSSIALKVKCPRNMINMIIDVL